VTPPGYDPAVPHPLLLVHDGLEFVELAGLPRVLSWLARQAPALELPVCVCVPPVQRDPEYRGERQEAFGRFVVETVLPYVAARYAVDLGPGRCASLGASNGGNISLYLLAAHPERFGYALVMSPYVDQRVRDRLLARPPSSYAVYLNWGRYDIPRLIPLIEDFTARLAELGVRHEAHRYDEGHSWGLWRATLPEALRCLDTWRRP